MVKVIGGEPPKGAVGVVVYPHPTLPAYARASVTAYWRLRPKFPKGRRGPFRDLIEVAASAARDAAACQGDLWVVPKLGT